MRPYWRTKDIGYTGISYPFRIGPDGNVAVATVDFESGDVSCIAEDLQQLVKTPIGSRFFNRSFGAAPLWIVFRRNVPEEMYLFASDLMDLLAKWEPRVEVTRFDVEQQFDGVAIMSVGWFIKKTQLYGNTEVEITTG
ncbi:MAG: hypothetical protein DRN68_07255 [Thaumarchaeota archaeon]|nr:MAG: hypothetical protein DRN68_07255 [Nitrososphaerota archaeon]